MVLLDGGDDAEIRKEIMSPATLSRSCGSKADMNLACRKRLRRLVEDDRELLESLVVFDKGAGMLLSNCLITSFSAGVNSIDDIGSLAFIDSR